MHAILSLAYPFKHGELEERHQVTQVLNMLLNVTQAIRVLFRLWKCHKIWVSCKLWKSHMSSPLSLIQYHFPSLNYLLIYQNIICAMTSATQLYNCCIGYIHTVLGDTHNAYACTLAHTHTIYRCISQITHYES